MKTVKQVAKLTGVSVRTLQYYDEIGLFKPTKINNSKYRLYDEEALKVLQQILFFKELDFQLSDIKKIMDDPLYNKIDAYKKQKELITVKRDRLNGLLRLLEKLEKGETYMSFKEFDMSDYLAALERFKEENNQAVIDNWGSEKAFDQFISTIKDKESDVAKLAIKQYGSIEKYTEAMKDNLAHFSEIMEKIKATKEVNDDKLERSKTLTRKLVSDLTIDVKSPGIQSIIHELVQISEATTQGMNMGEHFWDLVMEGYANDTNLITANDKIYGEGASSYMGRAYSYYFHK